MALREKGIHPSVADLADSEESMVYFHFMEARPVSTSIERWQHIFSDLVNGTADTIVPNVGERESLHPHGLSHEECTALLQLLAHHT